MPERRGRLGAVPAWAWLTAIVAVSFLFRAWLARGMLASGLSKGSRLGLLMPNSPDFVVAWLAAAPAFGVAVSVPL